MMGKLELVIKELCLVLHHSETADFMPAAITYARML